MEDNDRHHVRIKMPTRIFIEAIAATETAAGVLLDCNVVDVSCGGFRVKVESELIVGAILSVCVDLPAVEEPFYMSAEVKWCRPQEDAGEGWLAGFEVLSSSGTDADSWREILKHL